jgi:hypothetical protein
VQPKSQDFGPAAGRNSDTFRSEQRARHALFTVQVFVHEVQVEHFLGPLCRLSNQEALPLLELLRPAVLRLPALPVTTRSSRRQ